MDPIFPQPTLILPAPPSPVTMPPVSAISSFCQQDRIARLAALTPEDAEAGLLWLAMNFPSVCDAMLDKIEYDAIDDPDPAREPEPFCADILAGIARDLVKTLRRDVSTDWMSRDDVRAKIRSTIKRLLAKWGYPPDQQQNATDLVLRQMETFAEEWSPEAGR
jgi:hypothetical protein